MNWFESLKYILANIGKSPEPPVIVGKPSKKPKKKKKTLDLNLDPSTSWGGIVWHHSKGPDGEANDWDGIRRYHTSYRVDYNIVSADKFNRLKKEEPHNHSFQKPWSDIGYHGGVEKVNGIYVFQTGRPLTKTGAHAAVSGVSNMYNKTHIGLCAVGDFDKKAPTLAMWNYCLEVTREFMSVLNIDKDNVIGHREVYSELGVPQQKSCPGNKWDMDLFRDSL